MGYQARSEAENRKTVRRRHPAARRAEVRIHLARVARTWAGVCLVALLPFSASCNLQELGLSLKSIARGLGEAGGAPAEFALVEGDFMDLAQRKEVVTYLRRQSTGLSRVEEVTLADGILQASREYRMDYRLLLALMRVESRFSNWAISPQGAMGLMQVMPATGRRMARELSLPWAGTASLFDPVTNVQVAAGYLAKLRGRYGNLGLALMAYNRGPGALEALGAVDPNADGYVAEVLSHYHRFVRQSDMAEARGNSGAPAA
ncbi:MAG: lytic transglycosylase domain-containing protein [Dehalococcoidia bacterium]|nr:lytic transglycosylase domain-containing protein [Dehalococcoidia bacterium]